MIVAGEPDQKRIFIGWGEDVADGGKISERYVEKAAEALLELTARASEQGCTRIAAVATNSLRSASNGACIREALEDRAGIRIDVLSGRGEAFLGFAGATSILPAGTPAVLCDPGGTSTELSWGEAPMASGFLSIPVGAHTRDAAEWKLSGDSPLPAGTEKHTIVFTGGTAVSLAVLWCRIIGGDYDENVPVMMSKGDLELVAASIGEGRAELAGLLPPERMRLLPAGLSIVRELAGALGAREMTVTARDLRWGVVLRDGKIERGYLADEQESPDSR